MTTKNIPLIRDPMGLIAVGYAVYHYADLFTFIKDLLA